MRADEYTKALEGKKIPILVLDQKWHRLFAIHGKTEEIKSVEKQLDSLLAEQGKLNSELKELKKLKNKLMDEIVQNMDAENSEIDDEAREKKREDNKKLIDDINLRVEEKEDIMLELPAQTRDVNERLMLLSMEYFYSKIRVNKDEAREIEAWINQVRIDLKKNLIRKQNREINNKEIYAYLHDIFGHEVVEIFDLREEEDFEKSSNG